MWTSDRQDQLYLEQIPKNDIKIQELSWCKGIGSCPTCFFRVVVMGPLPALIPLLGSDQFISSFPSRKGMACTLMAWRCHVEASFPREHESSLGASCSLTSRQWDRTQCFLTLELFLAAVLLPSWCLLILIISTCCR